MASQTKEISLSIEETDVLRSKLGLKPLRVDNAKNEDSGVGRSRHEGSEEISSVSANASNSEEQTEARGGPAEAGATEAAIAEANRRKEEKDMQRRRVAHALLTSGRGIAQQAADEDLLDPLAWVSRLRKQKNEKEALQSQGKVDRVRYDDESEEEAEPTPISQALLDDDGSLPSTRVAHDASALPEGEELILTLQDAEILAPDGSLNEDGDILESVQLRAKEQLQKHLKIKGDLKRNGPYNAADDLETGAQREILSHYDEWEQEELARQGLARPPGEAKGFVLDDIINIKGEINGIFGSEHRDSRLSPKNSKANAATPATEAPPTFKRPRKSKSDKQRKTGASFWLSLATGENEQEDGDDLVASSDAKHDHASRNTKEKERNCQKEKVMKALTAATREREKGSCDDARGSKSKTHGTTTSPGAVADPMPKGEQPNPDAPSIKADVKVRSIQKALDEELRLYNNPTASAAESSGMADQADAEERRLLEQIKSRRRTTSKGNEKTLLPEGHAKQIEKGRHARIEEREEEGLQLTNTTEFCRTVLTPLEKANEKGHFVLGPRPNKANRSHSDKVEAEIEVQSRGWRSPSLSQMREDAEEGEVIEEPSENEEEEPEFLAEQPIGNSISGALAYLQQKDFFSLDKMRKRRGHHLEQPLYNGADDKEPNMDYRDAFGNVMTAKDAFRRISWHFHGKFPSLRKQEKKMRKIELERRLQTNLIDSLPTLKALQRVQENEGSAHIILTGGGTDK